MHIAHAGDDLEAGTHAASGATSSKRSSDRRQAGGVTCAGAGEDRQRHRDRDEMLTFHDFFLGCVGL